MRWASCALAVLTVLGCKSAATSIVVSVDTNFDIPAELDEIQIEVIGPAGVPNRVSVAMADGDSVLPATLTLVQHGTEVGPVLVSATGLLEGDSVVSRAARTEFLPGKSLLLRLFLLRQCEGVECGSGETCEFDGCIAAEVDPRALPEFSGPPLPWNGRDILDAGVPDLGTPVSDAEAPMDGAPDTSAGDTAVGVDVPTPTQCSVDWDAALPDPPGPDGGVPTNCPGSWLDCDLDGTCETEGNRPENCGACGNECSGATPHCNREFSGSGPRYQCRSDCMHELCGGVCVHTFSDPSHCRQCGVQCTTEVANALPRCRRGGGGCGFDCTPGFGNCDNNPDNGCETPVNTPQRCGGCNFDCNDAPRVAQTSCTRGTCVIDACAAGFADCDGRWDNGCEVNLGSLYCDGDGDGYGGSIVVGQRTSCSAPPGAAATSDDCDDLQAHLSPAATEQCNGVDENCNGVIDDGFRCGMSATGVCTDPCTLTQENVSCGNDCQDPSTCNGASCGCQEFGVDDYGYRGCSYVESEPSCPTLATPTPITLRDDDSMLVPIGFAFDFYGVSYSDVTIHSNGVISFGGGSSAEPFPSCLPATNSRAPSNMLAFWWEDLNPADGGTVGYGVVGTAPERKFVLSYAAPRFMGSSEDQIAVSVVLHEGSHDLSVCYLDAVLTGGGTGGAGAAMGLQSEGTGLPFSCREEDVVENDTLIHYSHPILN